MKWMVASDLHGSEYYCRELLKAFDREEAGRLLLLGDLLYHGPRNDLPKDYNPKAVMDLLNQRKESLLCVRGNCDAEVDQMVLEFPMMAEYAIINVGDPIIYATHGHVFGEQNPPLLQKGEILLCGHTHVPKCAEHENFIYMNPGSVSMPKENGKHGYMIIDQNGFQWKELDGDVYMEYPAKDGPCR